MPIARYDGLAEWYDQEQSRIAQRRDAPVDEFARLAGPGTGRFVELGCGTGLTGLALRAEGWRVVGVDLSIDQLALAARRCDAVLLGDAHHLPLRSDSVEALGMAFVHTDVDAFEQVMREVGRVLVPLGQMTYLGVHPCFVGHHVESPTKSGQHLGFGPGYRDVVRYDTSPQFGPGIRSRVGAKHVPLGEFLTCFIDAGLILDRVIETGDGVVPWMLGITAHRAAA